MYHTVSILVYIECMNGCEIGKHCTLYLPDVFPVVKQEPDWELDTSENFNQHASTQTPTEARDSGIDDCGQMDTGT